MLSNLVGNINTSAAWVLVILFVTIAAVIMTCVITFVVKRRSSQMVANDFFMAKLKEENALRLGLYQYETNRETKFKELDKNLITSHRSDG